MNLKLKNGNGITLIALVVTIIVILILAGISINALAGQNGILNKTIEAKEKTNSGQRQEKLELSNMEELIDENLDETGTSIEKTDDTYPGELEKESDDIFVINSIEDLVFFAYDVKNGNAYEGKTVKLGKSLDFNSNKSYVDAFRVDYAKYGYDGELKTLLTSGNGFLPIGSMNDGNINANYFKGIFDGQKNKIYNLYQNFDQSDVIAIYGLFGTNQGNICKLSVENINVNCTTSNMHVLYGGIAGRNTSIIEECSVSGNIKFTSNGKNGNYIGGIVGQNFGTIQKSYSKVNTYIIGGDNQKQSLSIGGIAGANYEKIKSCYNIGNILLNMDNIEDLSISGIGGGGNITNCYNVGKIQKKNINSQKNAAQIIYISGIGGDKKIASNYNIGTIDVETNNGGYVSGIGCIIKDNIIFENCYNVGKITSNSENILVGALTGWTTNQKIENCKWLKGTANAAIANKGSAVEDNSKMVDEINEMPSIISIVGNDFIEDYTNINGGYPILEWQKN